jgi:hypothetical protein
MTLTALEQTEFRNYISHRLLLEVERLIPEYIHTHHYLREDLEDKGYEAVEEAFIAETNNLTFHWT